jgi:hypothetical protein
MSTTRTWPCGTLESLALSGGRSQALPVPVLAGRGTPPQRPPPGSREPRAASVAMLPHVRGSECRAIASIRNGGERDIRLCRAHSESIISGSGEHKLAAFQ